MATSPPQLPPNVAYARLNPAPPSRNINDPNNKVNQTPLGGPAGTFDIATGAHGEPVAPGQGDYDQFANGGAGTGADSSDAWMKAFFGQYNLPADVQAQLASLLKQYAADPATGVALAQQYLRTTDWYQTTFPGFSQGVAAGLFTDETGYRNYLNQVNQSYNNYLGRHVSGDEVRAYLTQGVDPTTVGKYLQGDAYVAANRNDLQYLAGNFGDGRLSDQDLQSYGREQSGIDTASGQKLQAAIGRAQQRLTSIFGGSLARTGLSVGANGVSSPALGGTRQGQDVQT